MDWPLNALMPVFDRRTRCSRKVAAAPAAVWKAMMTTTSQDLLIFKPLMTLRHGRKPGMPGRLLDGAVPIPLLSMVDGQEVVFGVIGKFWRRSSPGALPGRPDPWRFLNFGEPDWVKAAMSIWIAPEGAGTRLSTETRVYATSAKARRLFMIYWPMVFLGSRLIRLDVLRAIARRAERGGAGARRPPWDGRPPAVVPPHGSAARVALSLHEGRTRADRSPQKKIGDST
ncbi:hypothetical protein ACGFJC_52995 [Nonomuraea fuscirosea]|uniref:hypothetical protein n=1 Tax=Nonomuraea fuscirosea TaxID=1291556 RepID=UPI003444249D